MGKSAQEFRDSFFRIICGYGDNSVRNGIEAIHCASLGDKIPGKQLALLLEYGDRGHVTDILQSLRPVES